MAWTEQHHQIDRSTAAIMLDVRDERIRAHEKHEEGSIEKLSGLIEAPLRLSILTEEVGEVAREINDATLLGEVADRAKLRAELVQVAAVAVAWVAALDRR